MTFTKEQLREKLEHRITVAAKYPDMEEAQLDAAIFKLALAALAGMEAEPVAWTDADELRNAMNAGSGYLFAIGGDANKFADPRRQMMLYTAPLAPVAMKDHQIREMVNELRDIAVEYHGTQQLRERIARTVRAAMLQGKAGGTLTNEGTIPATQFKPVSDLYGLTSPTGSETSFTFDAVEARDFIDGGWSCQEYVELERFQGAMVNGKGNSPVIPDGWKLVPIDPTKDMLRAGQSVVGFWLNTVHCYSKMLAAAPAAPAAPQQEADNG
ncbi:hypothetical protein ABHB64_11940 [Escherichia coli]|nr:hypothetical protein [Escherichia coli]MDB7244487.1 hypothetical protein [Escherichia coli]MDB8032650.1 hypothetical protein [Escherichia coli]MDZ9009143.1 hypothetical protein [Escherichia coli]